MTDDPLATEDPDQFPPDVLALALLKLRADGDHDAADALAAGLGTVGKACGMSAAGGGAGGFLVRPPGSMKRRRRKARRVVKAILRDVEGE